MSTGRLLLLSSFLVSEASCAGGAGRDSVPVTKDVVGDAGSAPRSAEGYEYVAKRPLAVVALAEARGLQPAIARAAVDQLADAIDACATEEGRRGSLVEGAGRIIAQIDDNGHVSATAVRVDPGEGVARSAVVCLVSPTKLLVFPPADAGVRGIAIEALWGKTIPAQESH
jgi:hypothetical protein